MRHTTRLKEATRTLPMVVAPGAFDVLSAKLAAAAGFQALHYGSGQASAMQVGLPDSGFLTLSETADQVRRIVIGADLPVIADGEAGYGNALHVHRTVRELEAAGAAAITLEDTAFGKHIVSSPPTVPASELADKIKAAVDTRRDGDLQVIARTDCLQPDGLSEAIDRVCRYAEAGADLVLILGLDPKDAPAVVGQVRVPLASLVPPSQPGVTFGEMQASGIALALFWNVPYLVAVKAMRDSLATLAHDRSAAALLSKMAHPEEIDALLGVEALREQASRYGLMEEARAPAADRGKAER